MEHFPPTAELLPEDIKANAFGGALPPELCWPELDSVLAHQKARGDRRASQTPIKTKKQNQHTAAASSPTTATSQQPLPSPQTFRLRADSSIVCEGLATGSERAGLANAGLAPGSGSEHICKECGKSMKGKHEHPEPPVTVEDLDLESDAEPKVGLDAFEAELLRASKAKAKATAMKKFMKTEIKKPAAAAKKAARKATLEKPAAKPPKDYPGWTMTQRMNAYPDGCSKCVHKPGCTPSCFYYRGE